MNSITRLLGVKWLAYSVFNLPDGGDTMRSHFLSLTPLLALLVVACGGGGESAPPPVVVTPPPTQITPPTPPPPPSGSNPAPSSAALVAPYLTQTPAFPITNVGGSNFEAGSLATRFPLRMTAVGPGFGGDLVVTNAGGVIDLRSDRSLALTLNAVAPSIIGMPVNGVLVPRANDRILLTSTQSGKGINYARHGLWLIQGGAADSGGVWSSGFETPLTSLPSTGQISLVGEASGLISEFGISGGAQIALLFGKAQLVIDYATGSVTGRVTRLKVGSDGVYVTGPVNDLMLSLSFDRSSRTLFGSVVTGASPVSPNSFPANVSGTISGQLFGPSGADAGAVLILSDGLSRMVLAFSVTSNTSCAGCWDY